MKGFRTLLINAGVVALVAVLHFLIGLDWTAYVSPQTGVVIVAIANMVLRLITDTPVGTSISTPIEAVGSKPQ